MSKNAIVCYQLCYYKHCNINRIITQFLYINLKSLSCLSHCHVHMMMKSQCHIFFDIIVRQNIFCKSECRIGYSHYTSQHINHLSTFAVNMQWCFLFLALSAHIIQQGQWVMFCCLFSPLFHNILLSTIGYIYKYIKHIATYYNANMKKQLMQSKLRWVMFAMYAVCLYCQCHLNVELCHHPHGVWDMQISGEVQVSVTSCSRKEFLVNLKQPQCHS